MADTSDNAFYPIMNLFWWIHLFFVLISIMQLVAESYLKDLQACFKLVITLCYILVFIQACIAHVKYNRKDSIFIVNHDAQFFVLIEIVIFMSSFFVVMITLFYASSINEKQIKKKNPNNTDLERRTQPD
jgi:hypothetical protein